MSHRRNKRTNVNNKKDNTKINIDDSLSKIQIKMKGEKSKIQSNRNMKITVYATIMIIATVSTGLFILPNLNLTGTSSYTTPQGTTLKLPDNMPSRYDSSLTKNPKLATAYQYAADHNDVLSQIICYCGCNNPMHQPYHANNDQCFWTTSGARETHAEGCSTCVYIALSAKTLFEANWSISNIRSYIDNQYT